MAEPIVSIDDLTNDAALAAIEGEPQTCKYPVGSYLYDVWRATYKLMKEDKDTCPK